MGFTDPWPGYSLALRTILFVGVPLFAVWQFSRLRRALHVFQLEGYKRARFIGWRRRNRRRSLFLSAPPAKKPLVMTGRAWRILGLATVLSLAAILAVSAAAHLAGGWPYDIPAWVVITALVFLGAPEIVVAADWLLAPLQTAINGRYVRAARRKLDRLSPVVIGVTGSFGKTSTKFAIRHLLGSPAEALATPGSFNTPLGVCRTINEQLTASHRFLVVEMGAYGRGEIRELCDLVRPSIGVLTAIGPAHLERFGSIDVIRRAKYELVESLPADGVAIMNVDDIEVRALADAASGVTVVRCGLEPAGAPDVTATEVGVSAEGTVLTVVDRRSGESISARTRLLGSYSLGHVLAAVAVGRAVGRPLKDLHDPIATLSPVEHRLQIVEGTGGITVIDDAYNSNPGGAAAALDVLEAMPARRRIVVTPGMVELGPLQRDANERFGAHAARVADAIVVVATVNRAAIISGAQRGDGGVEVVTVDSLAEAQVRLRDVLGPGDVVLFENDLPDHYES
jgi:UDP-N-acetylmuramoyl-tripeptide--D-alanyl-D-alanine ligase